MRSGKLITPILQGLYHWEVSYGLEQIQEYLSTAFGLTVMAMMVFKNKQNKSQQHIREDPQHKIIITFPGVSNSSASVILNPNTPLSRPKFRSPFKGRFFRKRR